jgi:hypothetical protein
VSRSPVPTSRGSERVLAAASLAILALGGAALVAPSCTYPDFRYEDETDDGEGGDGAASSSSSGPAASVPCGVDGAECVPGQVCCFHIMDETQDHCGASKTCGLDYNEFSCNTSEDCPEQICCGKDNDGDLFVDVISCQDNCEAVTEIMTCESTADCAGSECVELVPGYPGYRVCAP